MKHNALVAFLALALLAIGAVAPASMQARPTLQAAQLVNPTPKWQYKGCFASWCQTGWYASPAVADLNGDGRPRVSWRQAPDYISGW